jgi:hypothetical protein
MADVFPTTWPTAEPLLLGKRPYEYYKNRANKRLQSVTTIIKNCGWSGRALQIWANQQGLAGRNIQEALQPEADAGTIAHYFAECFAKQKRPDLTKLPCETEDQLKKKNEAVGRAQNAFIGFHDWVQREQPKWVANELKLVSEIHQFAGTIDAVALIRNVLVLVDFKTAKGVYADHVIQVAAYRELLREAKFDIRDTLILQIHKDDATFMPHPIVEEKLAAGWDVFKLCLSMSPYKKVLDSWAKED